MVEDSVTGFLGAVTGYCEYLHGEACYLVTPSSGDDNNKLTDGEWLVESRLFARIDLAHAMAVRRFD